MRENNIFWEQVHLSADIFIYVMNNVDSHPKSNFWPGSEPTFLLNLGQFFWPKLNLINSFGPGQLIRLTQLEPFIYSTKKRFLNPNRVDPDRNLGWLRLNQIEHIKMWQSNETKNSKRNTKKCWKNAKSKQKKHSFIK
jgi:hypothetical protein